MAEHSKLPWRYESDEDGSDIIAADGRMVADMSTSRMARDANASLIIKACNSHEALVKALEAYEAAIDEAEAIFGGEYADHYGPMFELAMKARDARRAALSSTGEAGR